MSALTVPSTVGAGSTIVVNDMTANQGGGSVGPSTTRFYLSGNNAFDASDVADGPYSVILEQVANGVAVRMAVLYLLAGGVEDEAAA